MTKIDYEMQTESAVEANESHHGRPNQSAPQPASERVIGEIIRRQRGFFDHGITGLVPLNMQTVANAIGVNVGTVSRAVAGRFIRTPHGIVALKWFFTWGYQKADGAEVYRTSLQNIIGRIIAEEDPRHPLSDRVIDAQLRQRGYPIARRTVTKYRLALGLPPFRLR